MINSQMEMDKLDGYIVEEGNCGFWDTVSSFGRCNRRVRQNRQHNHLVMHMKQQFAKELAIADSMYQKLEYFHAFTKRTPEEVKRGTLTPKPKGGKGGKRGNGGNGGKKKKSDGLNWDKPGHWEFSTEDDLLFLEDSRIVLGENSKHVNKFMKEAKEGVEKLESYCKKVADENGKRKAAFDMALIWNK